jgi:general secretion pathway protein K
MVMMSARFGSAHRSRGVALITVLLVFALVAIIAAEMLRRHQLSVRSVGNLLETRQAYYYALGGEAYARQLLAKDVLEHPNVDTLSEAWAQTKDQQPLEIEDGTMQIEIHDLQGRFNLNDVAYQDGVSQFKNLLKALQLNLNYANEWQRWITTASHSENTQNSAPASHSGPGRPEADISALRLLDSMQPEDYAKLAPHVTALPNDDTAEPVKININTADDIVLQAITSPTLTAQIVARQKTGGVANVDDVGLDPNIATTNSSFFEVVVTVNYANRWQRVRTVLKRTLDSGKPEITVLSRVRSSLIDDIELPSSN